MVLRCLPIHERENRYLGAGEELLDDDARTGAAECTAVDRVLDRLNGFFLGHGDRNTLAERKTIRLDNDRRAVLLDVLDRVREFSKTA